MRLLAPILLVAALGYFGWQHLHSNGVNGGDDHVTSATGLAAYAKWSLGSDAKHSLAPVPGHVSCSQVATYREAAQRSVTSITYYTCNVTYVDGSAAQQCWITIEPMPARRNSNVGQDPNDPGCARMMAQDPGTPAD